MLISNSNNQSIQEGELSILFSPLPLYKVIFYNDSVTTFDFVIKVLEKIFNKTTEEAENIALNVDKNGRSIVAVYPKEIAETKQKITLYNAKLYNFPFVCEIELE